MSNKRTEREIVALVRKKGGTYFTRRDDIAGDLLRCSTARRTTRQAIEKCVDRCIQRGVLLPIEEEGKLIGLRVPAR